MMDKKRICPSGFALFSGKDSTVKSLIIVALQMFIKPKAWYNTICVLLEILMAVIVFVFL